jgi:hypothetical protein
MKDRELKIEVPLWLWQNLSVMATQEMRDKPEFIKWLIYRESVKRGLQDEVADERESGDPQTA